MLLSFWPYVVRPFTSRLSRFQLNKTFWCSLTLCFASLFTPVIVASERLQSKEELYAERQQLEAEAVKNHASAIKLVDQRITDAAHDPVRQANLYLFKIGLLQYSNLAVLEEPLSKALQLFDPAEQPELYLYGMTIQAYIMSAYKNQSQQAAELLESLQEHSALQQDMFVYVKFLMVQLGVYYKLKQYEKVSGPLFRMAKTLTGRRGDPEFTYLQVYLNEALAGHSGLIGDVEQAKKLRLRQLQHNEQDGSSDDNAIVYCAIASLYYLPLNEKIRYAKASLAAKEDGTCSDMMEKLVLLGEIQQGKLDHVRQLAQFNPLSQVSWQNELSAYYSGLAYLHLRDSAQALKMAYLINREDSLEYQDLLRQSFQQLGDYQNAFIAAQRYNQLREQKDADTRALMLSSYNTRLEMAQEDTLAAEQAKQSEQLAAADQKAEARLYLMLTIIGASVIVSVVLSLHLYRSRQLQLKLQHLSDTDPLTGLLNRRAFLRQAEQVKQLAQRQKFTLSIALIDLDFFKKINDQHGHLAGDAVLRAFSDAAKATLRQTDIVGRFGGEEFILATTQQDSADFTALLQRLQQCFTQMCLQNSQIGFAASFSAGIANVIEHSAEGGQEIEVAIRHADEQLYRAKANGRHQVCTDDWCLQLVNP